MGCGYASFYEILWVVRELVLAENALVFSGCFGVVCYDYMSWYQRDTREVPEGHLRGT